MPKFTVNLTDAESERLDTIRAKLGMRSHAAVIRHWIERGEFVVVPALPVPEMTFTAGITRSRPLTEPVLATPVVAPPAAKPAGPTRTAKAYIRTPKRRQGTRARHPTIPS